MELTTFPGSPESTVQKVDEIDASEQLLPKIVLRGRRNEVRRQRPYVFTFQIYFEPAGNTRSRVNKSNLNFKVHYTLRIPLASRFLHRFGHLSQQWRQAQEAPKPQWTFSGRIVWKLNPLGQPIIPVLPEKVWVVHTCTTYWY